MFVMYRYEMMFESKQCLWERPFIVKIIINKINYFLFQISVGVFFPNFFLWKYRDEI